MTKKMSLPDTALENLADAIGLKDYRTIRDISTSRESHTDKVTIDVTVSINVSQRELKVMLKV